MATFWTPDGVAKEFDCVPPAPWQDTDPNAPMAAPDPAKSRKAELAEAIEALGGEADRRRSVEYLEEMLRSLQDVTEVSDGDDGT